MLAEAELELTETVETRTRLLEERAVHERVLAEPPEPPGPQEHLHGQKESPYVEPGGHARVLRVWGLVSVPLLLLGIVALLWQQNFGVLPAIGAVIFAIMLVEAFARGRTLRFLLGVAVLVVGVAAVLWMLINWRVTLTVVLATLAVLILVANAREALRRRRVRRVVDVAEGQDPV